MRLGHQERCAQGGGDLQTNEPQARLEAEATKSIAETTTLDVAFIDPADAAPVSMFLVSGAARMVSDATYDATAGNSANSAAWKGGRP